MQAFTQSLGVAVQLLPRAGRARRPQRHGVGREADQEGGARHDAPRARDQRQAARGGRQGGGRHHARRLRHLPSRRTDSEADHRHRHRRGRDRRRGGGPREVQGAARRSSTAARATTSAKAACSRWRSAPTPPTRPTMRWPTCTRTSSTTRSRRAPMSTMAQIKNAKGDKAGAIAALEKAVELDPNNAQAKAQLDNSEEVAARQLITRRSRLVASYGHDQVQNDKEQSYAPFDVVDSGARAVCGDRVRAGACRQAGRREAGGRAAQRRRSSSSR